VQGVVRPVARDCRLAEALDRAMPDRPTGDPSAKAPWLAQAFKNEHETPYRNPRLFRRPVRPSPTNRPPRHDIFSRF